MLSEADFRMWAEEGVELAGHSLRSWEAAVDYFRVSGEVMRIAAVGGFRRWAHAGRDLAEYSSVVAAAFFKASPQERAVPRRAPDHRVGRARPAAVQGPLEVDLARVGVLRRQPRHAAVADARRAGAARRADRGRRRAIVRAGDGLPRRRAATCSSRSRSADRAPFLTLATAVGEASWADVRICFERSPNLLAPIDPSARSRFLALASNVARRSGRHAYALFSEGAMALANVHKDRPPRPAVDGRRAGRRRRPPRRWSSSSRRRRC